MTTADMTIRHGSAGSYSSYSGAPHSPPQAMQSTAQLQPQAPPQSYPAGALSESDAHYWNNMFRVLGELGLNEQENGGYPTGMSDSGSFGSMSGVGGNTAYYEHGVGPQHNSYPSHASRYQPYPTPTYNSHSSHVGYDGLSGR